MSKKLCEMKEMELSLRAEVKPTAFLLKKLLNCQNDESK